MRADEEQVAVCVLSCVTLIWPSRMIVFVAERASRAPLRPGHIHYCVSHERESGDGNRRACSGRSGE